MKSKKLNKKALSSWIVSVAMPGRDLYEKDLKTHDWQTVEAEAKRLVESFKRAKDLSRVVITAYRYEFRGLYEVNRQASEVQPPVSISDFAQKNSRKRPNRKN